MHKPGPAYTEKCAEEQTLSDSLKSWAVSSIEGKDTSLTAEKLGLGVFGLEKQLATKEWPLEEALRTAVALGTVLFIVEKDENGDVIEISLRKAESDSEEKLSSQGPKEPLTDEQRVSLAAEAAKQILQTAEGQLNPEELFSEIVRQNPWLGHNAAEIVVRRMQELKII